jgi:hypothetical protein
MVGDEGAGMTKELAWRRSWQLNGTHDVVQALHKLFVLVEAPARWWHGIWFICFGWCANPHFA